MNVSDDYGENITIILARYLNDLWLFDTQEYKWNQVEFREMDAKPSSVYLVMLPDDITSD